MTAPTTIYIHEEAPDVLRTVTTGCGMIEYVQEFISLEFSVIFDRKGSNPAKHSVGS